MAGFTDEQVLLLDRNRQVVEVLRLFTVAFKSQTFRIADDTIERVVDGQTYQPALGWISAGTVQRNAVLDADPMEYVVSSLGESASSQYAALVGAALLQEDEWLGAETRYAMQLMAEGAYVGPPIVMHEGEIASITPRENVEDGSLLIRAESVFARRNRTPLGEYTDRDQQRRYPGDKLCQFVAALKDKVINGWLRT